MEKISICIITKNECNVFEECLKRIKENVPNHHEIVVLDTGSTDNTCDMVTKYTPNLYHFEWVNDFAKARNEAITHASNDWILTLDSDEWLEKWDEDAIQNLLAEHPSEIGRMIRKDTFTQKGSDYISTEGMGRLFNQKLYRYQKSIHEQIEYIDSTEKTYHFFDLPVIASHQAYMGSIDLREKRSHRNIALLENELVDNPNDPYIYYQLGQSYYMMEDYENAVIYFSKGLSFDVNPKLTYVQNMVETFGYSLLNTGRTKDALFVEDIYDEFQSSADFVFLTGLIYMQNMRFDDAIREFLKAASYKSSKVDGVNSYRALYNAGVIYECTNRIQEAKECYQSCGNYEPAQNRLESLSK